MNTFHKLSAHGEGIVPSLRRSFCDGCSPRAVSASCVGFQMGSHLLVTSSVRRGHEMDMIGENRAGLDAIVPLADGAGEAGADGDGLLAGKEYGRVFQ